MSEVKVRTLEELKAAKQAAGGSSQNQVAESSSSAPPGLAAVMTAVRNGEKDRVLKLLSEHPNLRLDHADADSYTLLHVLAQHNQPTLIALLCEKSLYKAGGKARCIDAQDKWRVTPLMLASLNGNGECVLLLLRHGADIALADHKGLTAEDHARKQGHDTVLRALRQHATSAKRKRDSEAGDGRSGAAKPP